MRRGEAVKRPPRVRLPALIEEAGAAPASELRRPLVEDPDGGIVAYGWREGDSYWLEAPGAAIFAFTAGGGGVRAHALGPAEAVIDAFQSLALPMALQVSGFDVLHASAVAGQAGVVGFCGFSGTGKTTTALALSRRPGYALFSDDVIVLENDHGAVFAHPLPFSSNVRPRTREVLGMGDAPPPTGEAGDPVPAAALVVLERVAEPGEASVRRLGAKEALPALVPHGFRFDATDIETRREFVRRYLALVASVPVLLARFVPSWETLDLFLDEIEAEVAAL